MILFAAFGLMLTLALPLLVRLIDDHRTKTRLQHLTAERERVSEEWEFYG
jgi:Tfp pilus assembly protein FimT